MIIHKHWSVTDLGLARLLNLSDAELKKEIASKNLFRGLSTEFSDKQNKLIYEKINAKRVKQKTRKADVKKDSKRNGRDNKKG